VIFVEVPRHEDKINIFDFTTETVEFFGQPTLDIACNKVISVHRVWCECRQEKRIEQQSPIK
jgi:hypothetical protein